LRSYWACKTLRRRGLSARGWRRRPGRLPPWPVRDPRHGQ
jgi:hypothetical protein